LKSSCNFMLIKNWMRVTLRSVMMSSVNLTNHMMTY
jgi:hypothetical protein